jgi:hypothetical protein
MSYNLTLSNGDYLGTLPDGNINTNYTSLTLVGKNYAGYGVYLNENFIKLTENFAAPTEPAHPLQGQIWWNTVTQSLMVRNASNTWKAVSSTTASNSSPSPVTTNVGDMWWDQLNTQLKVWSGSTWIVIGPAYTAAQGKTGIEATAVLESSTSAQKVILKFWVQDILTAVLSRYASFSTTNLPGFGTTAEVTINPGFNLASGPATGALRYYGDADNAMKLGGTEAGYFLRKDAESTTDFPFHVANNGGVTVGTAAEFAVDIGGSSVNVSSKASAKSLSFFVNYAGSTLPVSPLLTLDGTTGKVTVNVDPSDDLGVATKHYVDSAVSITGPALRKDGGNNITGNITPSSNNLLNFGSASTKFNTVYATNFDGVATSALNLIVNGNVIPASSFVRNDITQIINQPLNLATDAGITLGANGDFTINVDSTTVNLKSNVLHKDVKLSVMTSPGVPTTAFTVNGGTGLISVITPSNSDASTTIATKGYVDGKVGSGPVTLTSVNTNVLPTTNLTYTIGSPTLQWTDVYATTFHGVSMTANYADLAERFEADAEYAPGTVVEMGGTAEITAASTDLSDNVFGVISTKAAYLMNAGAGTDSTHPPIAMQGRVPVRVTGTVRKGDRLVSAGNGLARAALKSEITPFNVIGRALQNKLTNGEGTVEAIVKLNS